MAVPTFIQTAYQNGGSRNNPTVTLGATPNADDVGIIKTYRESNSDEAISYTVNGGSYTPLHAISGTQGGPSTDIQFDVAIVRFNGSSAVVSANYTTSVYTEFSVAVIRGCKASGDPVDVEGTVAVPGSTGTDLVMTGVTTTGTDRLLVACYGSLGGANWTEPGGMTERVDVANQVIGLATESRASAGATGDRTATRTGGGSSTWHIGVLLALLPTSVDATMTAQVMTASAAAPSATSAVATTMSAQAMTASAAGPTASHMGLVIDILPSVLTLPLVELLATVIVGQVDATGTLLMPMISVDASVTVSSPATFNAAVMTASASAPSAAIAVGSSMQAQAMTASAASPSASPSVGSSMQAEPMQANAAFLDALMASGDSGVFTAELMTASALAPSASIMQTAGWLAAVMIANAAMPSAVLSGGSRLLAVVMTATALSPAAVMSTLGIVRPVGTWLTPARKSGAWVEA